VYRQLIAERYNYAALKSSKIIPRYITEEMVDSIRDFFLNDVYPDMEKREKIEEAFETLNNYVSQPAKAFGLFGSVAGALRTFGRHLPAAINAGVVTLQSFLDARRLENKILEAAHQNQLKQSLTLEDLKKCIVNIPRSELENFLRDVEQMFLLMSDTQLLQKTLRIIDMVIERMKSKPKLYSEKEIAGIELGRNILQNGLNLFKNYDLETRKVIARTIYDVEMSFINNLYSQYKD